MIKMIFGRLPESGLASAPKHRPIKAKMRNAGSFIIEQVSQEEARPSTSPSACGNKVLL
jgi:hypothetical protein